MTLPAPRLKLRRLRQRPVPKPPKRCAGSRWRRGPPSVSASRWRSARRCAPWKRDSRRIEG